MFRKFFKRTKKLELQDQLRVTRNEMRQLRTLLEAQRSTIEALKGSLVAQRATITEIKTELDGFREQVTEDLSLLIDYDGLTYAVTNSISPADIAGELNLEKLLDDVLPHIEKLTQSAVLNAIDYATLAETVDVPEIAKIIDLNELAYEIAGDKLIDYGVLADCVSSIIDHDDIAGRIEFNLATFARAILRSTASSQQDTAGHWSDLEWAILMVIRKALTELAE